MIFGWGFPTYFPSNFFVSLSPKRDRVLETWGDCYAPAFGARGWKEKPRTPEFNNPFETAWREGHCHPSPCDVPRGGQAVEQLHVLLSDETGNSFLASSAHLYSSPYRRRPQRKRSKRVLRLKNSAYISLAVRRLPCAVLVFLCLQSTGEACPMETLSVP